MGDEVIVILGATLAEARYWKAHYTAAYPELSEAQEHSAGGPASRILGMRIHKLYIAPGAREGKYFPEVFNSMRSDLLKTPGSVDPIYLGTRLAGIEGNKS